MTNLRIILPAVASVLVVAAAVVALWIIGSASGERAKFSSLEFAPKDTEVFVAINTDPTSPQWLAVNDSLEAVNAKDPIQELIDEALDEFDLEWERDITPVAGDEAFFSVADIDDPESWTAGVLVRDADKARETFDAVREEEEPLEEEEYEGVTIYFEGDSLEFLGDDISSSGAAIAFMDDLIALGSDPDQVKSVIDVAQGNTESAEENERLEEFRGYQGDDDFLVWGYADMAGVWDVLEDGLATEFGASGAGNGQDVLPPPTAQPDDFTVTSFDSEYEIDPDGYLYVTERIAVDFADVAKHGIFRDIPTVLDYDLEKDELVAVETTSVSRDGAEEQFEDIYGLNTHQIKIGDPDITITGAHIYEIQYTVYGGVHPLEDAEGPFYDVYWNATGNDWPVPIEHASATVKMPNGFLEARCFEGPIESNATCTTTSDAESVRFESTQFLAPGSGMRFGLTVRAESAAEPALVPSSTFDGFDDGEVEVVDDSLPGFPFDPEETIDEVRGMYDRIGFSLSSMSHGFAFDVTVLHAPDYEPETGFEPAQAYEPAMAGMLPADTMFYYSMFDVYGQTWRPAREGLDDLDLGDGQTLDDLLDSFEDDAGIDIDEFLSLFTGELAIAGNVSDFEGTPEFDILALAEVADAATAEELMAELGDYLERETVIFEPDEERGVTKWNFGDTERVAWGLRGKTLAFGYPEDAVEDAINIEGEALADTDDWKRTIDKLPDDMVTFGYLSLARILEEVQAVDEAAEEFEQSTDGKLTLEDLAAIRTLAFGANALDKGIHFRVVLLMKDD